MSPLAIVLPKRYVIDNFFNAIFVFCVFFGGSVWIVWMRVLEVVRCILLAIFVPDTDLISCFYSYNVGSTWEMFRYVVANFLLLLLVVFIVSMILWTIYGIFIFFAKMTFDKYEHHAPLFGKIILPNNAPIVPYIELLISVFVMIASSLTLGCNLFLLLMGFSFERFTYCVMGSLLVDSRMRLWIRLQKADPLVKIYHQE